MRGADPGLGRMARLRGHVVDVSPLRLDPDYRRLWTGQSINVIGSMVTRVALPYQVYVLTGSPLALAALTFVQLIPVLTFTLFGGALADAFDRRKVLIGAQVGLGACSLALALLALQRDPSVPLLFVIAFVAATFSAIDWPARGSATPRLVPAERLRAAIALGQLSFNAGSVVGPLVAGVLLGTVGLAGAYVVDVVSYALALGMLVRMRPIPPLGERRRPGLEDIRVGLRFVRRRRLILSTFAIDLNAMIFGSPRTLYPVLALDVFGTGELGLGLLNAAPAAGALVAILFSGGVTRIRRMGRGIILAVAAWGAAILAFGLATSWFWAALLFLAVAGGADVISAVLRSSTVQMTTPDDLRGRVQSVHMLVVTAGPQVGDIEAALVAAVVGAQLSVISGGVLTLLGVLVVARLFPELDRHVAEQKPAPAQVPGPAG